MNNGNNGLLFCCRDWLLPVPSPLPHTTPIWSRALYVLARLKTARFIEWSHPTHPARTGKLSPAAAARSRQFPATAAAASQSRSSVTLDVCDTHSTGWLHCALVLPCADHMTACVTRAWTDQNPTQTVEILIIDHYFLNSKLSCSYFFITVDDHFSLIMFGILAPCKLLENGLRYNKASTRRLCDGKLENQNCR